MELGTGEVQPLKLRKTFLVTHDLTKMNLKITDVVAFRASDLILGKMGIHLGRNSSLNQLKKSSSILVLPHLRRSQRYKLCSSNNEAAESFHPAARELCEP